MRIFLILLLVTSAQAEEISHQKKVAGIALFGVSAAATVFALISGIVAEQPTGCTQYSDQPVCLHGPVALPAALSLGGIAGLTLASGLPLYFGGRADPSHRLALRRSGYAMMALAATATAVTIIGVGLAFSCNQGDCGAAGLIMSTMGPSLAGVSLAVGIPLVTF